MNPTESSSAAPASSSGETSRRRLLALLGAGGAAGVATLLSRDEARAGHDGTNVMHLGVSNSNPASPTSLHAPSPGDQVFNVFGRTEFVASRAGGPPTHDGVAFKFRNSTTGDFGTVIQAITQSPGAAALMGFSNSQSEDPPGLDLESTGVLGFSPRGFGIAGNSDSGIGVSGNSPTGIGVHGSTLGDEEAPGTGVGVKASAQLASGTGGPSDGTALQVQGRAAFTSVGSGEIPAGQSSVRIEDPHVTENSHISVTLASDPGERQVRWVERESGAFTVHLTPAPAKRRPQTALTYFVLEDAEFDCC